MSTVSGVVLMVSVGDLGGRLGLINKWLDDAGFPGLRDCSDEAVGTKHPQALIFMAGYNGLPEDDFADFVMGLDWSQPENVVLAIQPEEWMTRIWRPERASGRRWGLREME